MCLTFESWLMRSENGAQRSRLSQMLSVLRRRSPLGARATQLDELGCSKAFQKRSFLERLCWRSIQQ
jgi:hypothetical protein